MTEPTPQLPHAPLPDYYRDEADHTRYVRRIFDETAVDYDRIERTMAFGSGSWYRREALVRAGLAAGDKVVDVVETHNLPALKLHVRMGYQEQGRVAHVYCLFGRWKFFRETSYTGSRIEPLCRPRRVVTAAAAA